MSKSDWKDNTAKELLDKVAPILCDEELDLEAEELRMIVTDLRTENAQLREDNKALTDDMADYDFIVEQVAKVYDHITNGQLSKPNYLAEVVIAHYDDCITADFKERIKEETEELAGEINTLKADKRELVEALGKMNRAYVRLLEDGYERIMYAGGNCDPVDIMEASSPDLRQAKAAVAKHKEKV